MAKGARFVEVPAAELLKMLGEIGSKVQADGGRFVQRQVGREVVMDLVPPGGNAMLTVYTSLAAGEAAVRDCGEDAIRFNIGVEMPEGYRLLDDSQKILRTAPRDESDRVKAFLERLRGELRAAYLRAWNIPLCPKCRRPMAIRSPQKNPERKFYGCIGFPGCDGVRSIPKTE